MVAGGGGGVVKSGYSKEERSQLVQKYNHGEHRSWKGCRAFGVLDYICQSNETEQKLPNIKLFQCIPHVLNIDY